MVKKIEKKHNVHHYLVVGRHVPTKKIPIIKFKAKCIFFYFLKKLDKVKKTSGEILVCH